MTLRCNKCNEVFESNGLEIVAHGKAIGWVCPACIASAKTVLLILEQKTPGEFVLRVVEPQTEASES